jgi:hypothetical protein
MRIKPIESQLRPEGAINTRRANADDFGLDTRQAQANMQELSGIFQEQADAKNKVWQANALSTFQLQKYQEMQDMQTDPDFANKYGADGGGFVKAFDDKYAADKEALLQEAPDRRTKQALDSSLAGVRTNMTSHAIGIQAQAGGSYIRDQLVSSQDQDAKLVFQAPELTSSVLDQGKKNIAEAPYLTPDQKRDLMLKYEQDITMAAGMGQVQRNPEGVLGTIAPDELSKFKPTPRVLANAQNPIKGFSAAGAPAKVGKEVQTYAPTTQRNAADFGVDANFLMAQQQVESGGNIAARNEGDIRVTGQPSLGLAQFQPATAARYGIDPLIPEQAIQGQANYMSDLLKMFNGDYRKAAAGYNWGEGNVQKAVAQYGNDWFNHIPASTKDYIGKIFDIAQPIPSAGQSFAAIQGEANAAVPSRANTNPDWFNKLSWDQQYKIVQTAEQGVRANQVRDAQLVAFEKQKREAQQQATMNTMFDQLLDNKLTVDEVRQNQDLDYQGKEHMINAINKQIRGETGTRPEVFLDLFNRINAEPGDPNKISSDKELISHVGNGISFEDLNKLRGELRGKNTPDGETASALKKNLFSMARKQIDTSIFGASVDPEGARNFYNFQQAALTYISKKQQEGANVLDLFDPNNKDYVGKLIPQYTRSPQQQLNDMAKAYNPAAPVLPRQPGETIEQYNQRTGVKP